MRSQEMKIVQTTVAFMVAASIFASDLLGCTRILYEGERKLVLTARSMDFSIDIPANMWIFPRGMERSGMVGEQSFLWRSRYGSLVVSAWDIASPDGMNEKGLVANLLWLVKSQYPEFDLKGSKKAISISLWAQYVLDNFATVKEAVAALKKEEFVVVSDYIPGTDKFTTVHLSISDALGDSAIMEYIDGKLVIHHNSAYTVLTNDPPFEEQLAIEAYFKKLEGTKILPGTNSSSDRFVRAAFYLQAIPQTSDASLGFSSIMSVLRNVSVPFGITTPDAPHISSTRWRVVADQKNLHYYFENVLTPNIIKVDLGKIDFSQNAGVKRLKLDANESYNGDVSDDFEAAEAFEFKGI
jgi:penicillin V acylase-like amidase (Ntn superfamily)